MLFDYWNQKKITSLPESLQGKLYEFQKKGIEFGVKNYGRVLIADEMVGYIFMYITYMLN